MDAETTSDRQGNNGSGRRRAQVDRLVEQIVRRRSSGEFLPDSEVIALHADLMPELGDRLRTLRKVERAANLAKLGMPAQFDPRSLAIPGYQIEQEVYRGGQGVVYRAQQLGTGRVVAVKVMRDGPFVGPRDLARFEREVRVLARLRHPNIVTIHDSGISDGLRYFVMDYIEGHTLDEFLASRELDVDQILRLFIKIANAVNAAHLRGVIHRDLKPGNVRVDWSGEPRVLDFGLAKLVSGGAQEASSWRHMTVTGQFVGSVHWASPEQAEGPASAVDLRTDVYSLGVMLFHMFTGEFPYPVSGNAPQVVMHILRTEPQRPGAFRRGLDEDVETIVLKCLAKEPSRRYQSVAGLVDDLERYLGHLPILARAPSTIYQIRKLMVRHKLPFAMLILLFLLTTGFSIWMSVLYGIAASDRTRARAAEARAATEADAVQVINDFLVNDLLASAQPANAQGREVTVEEVLDAAAERVEGAFVERPLVEAALRSAIGQSYRSLGLFGQAEPQLREAFVIRTRELGNEHPETLESEYHLAGLLASMARYDEAEPLSEHALQGLRRVLGEDDQRTLGAAGLRAQLHLYIGRLDQAETVWESTLERQRRIWGDDHSSTLATLSHLAFVQLVRCKKNVEAEQVYREVYEDCVRVLGESHPNTLAIMISLGRALTSQRKFDEAEAVFQQAMDGHLRVLGEDHPSTLSLLHEFAFLRQAQGRLDEAIVLRRTTVERGTGVLGGEHPLTLQAREALAHTLGLKGACAEALAMHRETLASHRRLYSPAHVSCAHSLDCKGKVLAWLGRYREAEECLRESYRIYQQLPRREEAATSPLRDLVAVLGAQGRGEDARPFAEALLATRRRAVEDPATDAYRLNCYARELLDVYPEDLRNPELALEVALDALKESTDAYHYNRYTLGRAYAANGDQDSAIEMLRQALAVIPLESSRERSQYESALVGLYEARGDVDAAVRVFHNTLVARREHFPHDHPDIGASLFDLGTLLNRHGKHAEAEAQLRECLDLREALLADPESEPYRLTLECHTAETLLALGQILVGHQRHDQAEPLLLEAHERLANNGNCHTRLRPAAIRGLAALYRVRNQPEVAAAYSELLSGSAEAQVGDEPPPSDGAR